MLTEKDQAVGRFRRVALDVLAHELLTDFVEDRGDLLRIDPVESEIENAGILAALRYLEHLLVPENGLQSGGLDNDKAGSQVGLEFFHKHGKAVLA